VSDTYEWAFLREWKAISDEAQAMMKENEEKHGVALPFAIGDYSLEKMREREQERAERILRAALHEFAHSSAMPAKAFHRLTGLTGRIYGPMCLYMLDHNNALAPEAYADVVSYTWGLAEFPGLAMSRPDWRRLWAKSGFVIDGKPADRPAEPMLLWRGATRGHKGGMAWTDDRKRAEWFVQARFRKGHLWEALVPPERLLAFIHNEGRGESEWIVDTRGVTILQVE